ncbi:MAG: histidine kinase [Herbinix sp.]|nr:histidine kinase [Herbinix sp.]
MLFICCLALYLFHANNSFAIIPVIISIVFSCLFVYYDNYRLRLTGILIFIILCLLMPNYIIFLPLLLYEILHTKYQFTALLILFPLIYYITIYSTITVSFTAVFLAVSYLLKFKTDHLNKLSTEYNDLRDSSAQMSLLLEEKNQDLLKNQDFEVNLATLNERNRISKEIHDNIGHLLSRALLQVGALQVVSKDEATKEGLTDLKESLSVGMDQIRSSIHKMYDESIDLYVQIEHLVKDFTFCTINYDYDIKNAPPLALKHSLIAITKESLSNIMRHSNATKVSIALHEHPAMYQLIIQDNGIIEEHQRKILSVAFENQDYGEGMGLRNIYDRVKSFNGNINVTLASGYKLFISIPKSAV